MHFIARVKRGLSILRIRTVEELVGRTDLLQRSSRIDEQSKATLDIEKLLDSDDGLTQKKLIKIII